MAVQGYNRGRMLHDVKKNGKEREWDLLKKKSRYLAKSYKRLGNESKAVRVHQCGNDLYFKPKADGTGLKLYKANFCQIPLCTVCSVRKTSKIFGQTNRIMNYIDDHENYKYVFLTLTVRNSKGERLNKTVDEMMMGFHRLVHRVMFKRMSRGWFRALEFTYRWVEGDYHPHLHMIIGVDEKYFTDYENYVTHKEWKEEWRECMRLQYEPWVYVEKVRKNRKARIHGQNKLGNVVAEVAKYAAKSNDYLVMWEERDKFEKSVNGKIKIKSRQQCYDMTDEVVSVLDDAMYKRRLVAYGGKFKEVHKLLNLDDPENGDLLNTDNEEMREDLTEMLLHYRWNAGIGHYMLVEDTDYDNAQV